MSAVVLTVGHSNHAMSRFVELLRQHRVTAVADVRSQPYSRMNPQFNREALKDALKMSGISYAFLGRELGARSDDPSCYVEGKVQYDRLARAPAFKEGLERVESGSHRFRIALMCAEKDPLTCHRTILVVRHLAARGIDVEHILADGRLEPHEEALRRLLREVGLNERDLFTPRQELLDEAYARRGSEIAYVARPDAPVNGSLPNGSL